MSTELAVAGARSAQGRLRWKRFAIIVIPAAIIAFALIALTARGAIGASISVSGKEYTVTANQLTGNGFEQFGTTVSKSSGGGVPVAESAIKSAKLSHLCQAVSVGPMTLLLKAGSGNTPVSANNLIVDASELKGNATFHNIVIGQDASSLSAVPGATGSAGSFGEQASSITIDNLHQNTWLTTAGTFTLPGLDLSVRHNGSCP